MNGNDIFCTVEGENLSKVKNSNHYFLHFNLSFPNEYDGKFEWVLGFGNPALFCCLGGNGRIFIDGTFKIVPKPFYQCLIRMVFDEQTDSFVPVFYILLTFKTEQVYRIALFWVKLSSNYKIRPLSITCAFEKALRNAISIKFPQIRYVSRLCGLYSNPVYSDSGGCVHGTCYGSSTVTHPRN